MSQLLEVASSLQRLRVRKGQEHLPAQKVEQHKGALY